ncbi:metallophosphoesterase family protein [Jatrophihabitans sp. DSM 45814]
MRILLTSDIHYRLPSMDWLCAVAADYDALVLAGDLLDTASPVPLDAQIVVVASYLRRLAQLSTVFVASGNHDLDGPGVHGEQVSSWLSRPRTGALHTDGQSVDLGAIRITVCPWWDGPVTRTGVDVQLRSAAADRPASWIWVYHSPPAGTVLCSDGRRSFPDRDLAGWIEEHQPDLVMCGHIHQAPWAPGGSWYDRLGATWVFNAGHLAARVPPHIVFDTGHATAQWFATVEDEPVLVDLDAAAG